MRVSALTVLLTTALVSVSALAIQPAMAATHKVTCLCDCPDDHKVKAKAAAVRPMTPPPRKVVRRTARRYAGGGSYYSYGGSAPIYPDAGIYREWRSEWRQAPNDAFIPGPAPMMAYGPPPPPPEPEGLRIDDRGFMGGVGDLYGGGGGGGGGDGGYGQIHFGNGGSVENGPTYNSYNQSFQYNPSQAGPFQNRLMGGFAPPPKTK